MTTSFSSTVERGGAQSGDPVVAGNDGVLVLDAALRCISADATFVHLFDMDAAALVNRPLADTPLPKPLIAALGEAVDAALAGNGIRRAQVAFDDDNAARSFAILALPSADTVTLVVSPCANGSGEVSAGRIAHLRAEAALFMRDHVLSIVSHDLRGPLNAIHSWGYVLERKVDAKDPAAQRALTGIRSGVEQQVKLIEQSVDTTRAETRAVALSLAPAAVRPLLEKSVALARGSIAQSRGITFAVESPLAEEQVEGDAERLTQMLWLMLVFAAEASARDATVQVSSVVEGGMWRTDVRFTTSAQALTDASSPHALEAFARRQSLEPREAGRIAWGLALCKRVAEAHGGGFEQANIVDGQEAVLSARIAVAGM
ncbi:HAMP domain-containing sensor histidine kinase [Caballeronia sp. LZ062]|uniref:sensor histidine kinase n=1 Tax=unclassified Caballeronia TaxID=2646786 RepID=UPI0028617EED|nr:MULTISPECIES: HAMP domain-containing sensor histidine kinase [unclassified Caballeronia]MDR5856950.1 HAMP domain-containing sensor histidine kinase [Caballeronia sp. LZ050]MDR5869653.1 HAMP domain-containing sensor histidine kinase [Caballeronia sp. LZ062]